MPSKGDQKIPHFPETPERTLDLTHIVPPTPPPVHNGFHDFSRSHHSLDASSMESTSVTKSPIKALHHQSGSLERGAGRVDDEHRLIARYAARLAADANNASRSPTELNYHPESSKAQRELIAQLEAKNREILGEIQRLRKEQEQHAKVTPETQPRNPTLLAELRLLRQRRDELEARMAALQDSRRELMVQLEGLMKLLKNHGSPRSTPNSSPRSRNAVSPPVPQARASSAPTTPGDSLAGVGGDVRQAFTQQQQQQPQQGTSTTSSVRSLRNDLLVAADSVTNAMSSLVKELNSEASSGSEEDDDCDKNPALEANNNNNKRYDELAEWQAEMQERLQQESEFLRELRARKDGQTTSESEQENYFLTDEGEAVMRTDDESFLATDDGDSYIRTDEDSYMRTDEEDAELYDKDPKELGSLIHQRYTTDEESCLETDQESYIRTDDEEGGNTEWEEAMQRWVNR